MTDDKGPSREESERLRDEWAERHGFTESRTNPYCVCRLLGKVCPEYGAKICANAVPEADHCSLWYRDGKPAAFVSQPYAISEPEALGAFCRERGLECAITTYPAWHYPGHVLHVEIRRAEP